MFAQTWHDFLVGLGQFLSGSIGLTFHIIIGIALFKLSAESGGFVVLFSDAIANWGQIVVFSLWPGIITMLGQTFLPKLLVAVINDGFWFTMSQHYFIIAVTRYIAIAHPFWFRANSKKFARVFCAIAWLFAIALAIYLHTVPTWKTTFYYNATMYGFVNDEWHKYFTEGEDSFWKYFNAPIVCGPLVFYVAAAFKAWKQRHAVATEQGVNEDNGSRLERRLLLTCFINQGVYFMGSNILFSRLLQIGGKWGCLAINIYFTTNSLINPIMLICMCEKVRVKVLGLFR